jgi:tetratricopeptide (TPR) repeat protein
MDAENYESAITHLMAAVELEGNSEQRATLYLTLGDLLDQKGEYEDAEDSYDEAASASGIYVNEYLGYLGAARMVAKQGDYDGALDELDELRTDDNYREFFGDIELEMGRVLVAGGEYESAIEMFNYVDTAYARTEVAANSLFEKGRLYEEDLGWYDSAKVAYDKGRRTFPQAEITSEIVRRADYMTRYYVLIGNELDYDSLRTALLNPVELIDSLEAVADTSAGQADSVSQRPSRPPLSLDSVNVLLASNRSDLGALFYTTINVLDSAKVWYTLVVEESPNSAVAPASLFALAQIYGQDATAPPGVSDSLHREIVRRFPGTEFSAESRRILGMPPGLSTTDPGEAVYTSAEQRFLNGEYQSAIQGYQAVVEGYPESDFAPMAQYAIGYIYENSIGLMDSAVANYEKLIAMYPRSSYATRVRPRIAQAVAVRLAAAQEDSIAAARRDSVAAAGADSLLAAQPDSLAAAQNDSLAAQGSDSLAAVQNDSLAATQGDSLATTQNDSVAASAPQDTSLVPQEPTPEQEGVSGDSTGAPTEPPGGEQPEIPSAEPPRDNRRPR